MNRSLEKLASEYRDNIAYFKKRQKQLFRQMCAEFGVKETAKILGHSYQTLYYRHNTAYQTQQKERYIRNQKKH